MVTSHIFLRARTYRVRFRIPVDLRHRIGRREISRSLGTGDQRLARRRGARATASLLGLLEQVRSSPEMPRIAITELVARWVREELDRDLVNRSDPPAAIAAAARERGMPPSLYYSDAISGSADADLERMLKVWQAQDLKEIRRSMTGEARRLGVTTDPGTAEFLRLAKALFIGATHVKQAQIERSAGSLKLMAAVDLSDFDGEEVEISGDAPKKSEGVETESEPAPADVVDLGAHQVLGQVASSVLTLRATVDRYLAEMRSRGDLSSKRENAYATALELLIEVLGGDVELASLKTTDVGQYRQVVTELPASRAKRFPGLGYKEAISQASAIGSKRLDDQTIKSKYISTVRQFFDWCVKACWLEHNPASNLSHKVPKKREKARNPFSNDDLRAIFGSPLYLGCKSAGRITTPGTCLVQDHRYWMPLIALFTGARLGEICQLRLADVVQRDGVWCFDINEDDGKSVKTKASVRSTPIHPTLIDLGFLAYVENLQRASRDASALWPDVRVAQSGYASDLQSKRQRTFLDAVLGAEYRLKNRLTFHSYRHTIIDALRTAGVTDDVRHAIVGQEGHHVEQQFYGKGYGPQRLFEELRKISYPVPWERLHTWQGSGVSVGELANG